MTDTGRKNLITIGERAIYELQRKLQPEAVKLTPWQLAAAVVDSIPGRKWYAVACKEFQERRAASELGERKVEFYRPKFFRHPDDEDYHLGAMGFRFTGYVLVHIDVRAGEHTVVKHTPGVDDFVKGATGGGDTLYPLPADAVLLFRQFEEGDFDRVTLKKPGQREDLYPGCQVRVDDETHHLHGHQGTLMVLDRHAAKIMIGLSSIDWTLDPAILRKVEAPKPAKKGEKAA
jgi:transcription antitermination factor NusG